MDVRLTEVVLGNKQKLKNVSKFLHQSSFANKRGYSGEDKTTPSHKKRRKKSPGRFLMRVFIEASEILNGTWALI